MLTRTEGIVLKTTPYGEADLIVSHITPDLGLVKTFAKSPRKTKSRFGSSLEPLTYAKISFWGREDAALPRLTQSDIIHSFQSLREQLACFLKVLEIIELTINFTQEKDSSRKIFTLLLDTLKTIEEDHLRNCKSCNNFGKRNSASQINLLTSSFKVKFLKFSGFAPKIDACGRCSKNGSSFYLSHGSVLCESCVAESITTCGDLTPPVRLSPSLSSFYSNLMTWDTSIITRIRPAESLIEELNNVLNLHIKYILSKPLKASSFLGSVTAGQP